MVFQVLLEAQKKALWTLQEVAKTAVEYLDNFFHLLLGENATFLMRPDKAMTAAEFQRKLRIKSVVDIAPAMRASKV